MDFVKDENITEDEIVRGLAYHISSSVRSVTIPRTVLAEFERDLMLITKSHYVHEYEIKRTRNDYAADFRKIIRFWERGVGYVPANKHRILKGDDDRPTSWFQPASFTFVLPAGLMGDGECVPGYCGLIEYELSDKSWKRLEFKTKKKRPRLKRPDRLTPHQMYVLLSKMESRFWGAKETIKRLIEEKPE